LHLGGPIVGEIKGIRRTMKRSKKSNILGRTICSYKSISNSLANFVSQISLFANSQNNMGRKKISSPTVWQILFLKTQKLVNETKRPAKRTKNPVKRTKSPAKHEETTMRGRCPARIYARNRPRFANLPKMPNLDTKLLEKYFSHFAKNFRMPNSWRCSKG
jgi:hypothetical protein